MNNKRIMYHLDGHTSCIFKSISITIRFFVVSRKAGMTSGIEHQTCPETPAFVPIQLHLWNLVHHSWILLNCCPDSSHNFSRYIIRGVEGSGTQSKLIMWIFRVQWTRLYNNSVYFIVAYICPETYRVLGICATSVNRRDKDSHTITTFTFLSVSVRVFGD